MTGKALLRSIRLLFLLLPALSGALSAQPASRPLGAGPWIFDTFEEEDIRVSVVARNLDHPFGMVFLPGTATADNPQGDLLISERTGKVRHFRQGRLLDEPVADLTGPLALEQLYGIVPHPRFEQNGLIYFSYMKEGERPDGSEGYWTTTALGRGRFDGDKLVDVQDVYVAEEAWSSNFGGASSRVHFMPDGTLLLGVSHRLDEEAPQRLDSHIGKILRLNDDGSVPRDNPFIGVEGALPEIYTWGMRSVMDFTTHPDTGEIWEVENGPQGGDEVNVIRPGLNYGWPIATFGLDYDGTRFSPQPWVEGTELPRIFWVPSITVSSLSFYTGDRFPAWKGNLFVTAMIEGRVPGTGHLQRVVFNEQGEIRREQLLNSLRQRLRYVRQGPDGLLYVLTDEDDGALLRLEPAGAAGQSLTDENILFPEHDCRTCHRLDGPLIGPSYLDIARRYELTEANIALLAGKITQGGAGVWGEVPMTPHPDLPPATARDMAVRILGLEAESEAATE